MFCATFNFQTRSRALMMQAPFRFITLNELNYIELKELRKIWKKTVKQFARLKIQLTSCTDQVFPELQYFFMIIIAWQISPQTSVCDKCEILKCLN